MTRKPQSGAAKKRGLQHGPWPVLCPVCGGEAVRLLRETDSMPFTGYCSCVAKSVVGPDAYLLATCAYCRGSGTVMKR